MTEVILLGKAQSTARTEMDELRRCATVPEEFLRIPTNTIGINNGRVPLVGLFKLAVMKLGIPDPGGGATKVTEKLTEKSWVLSKTSQVWNSQKVYAYVLQVWNCQKGIVATVLVPMEFLEK
eukprot:scaffold426198_cov49-Prasinocladus_malaysianus.AAC.2